MAIKIIQVKKYPEKSQFSYVFCGIVDHSKHRAFHLRADLVSEWKSRVTDILRDERHNASDCSLSCWKRFDWHSVSDIVGINQVQSLAENKLNIPLSL